MYKLHIILIYLRKLYIILKVNAVELCKCSLIQNICIIVVINMNSETAIKIVDYIRENLGLCKNELSQKLNISYHTISKYVDFLQKNKILRAVYTKNSLRDNRIKRYYLNLSNCFVIFNFTFEVFEAYIISPSLKIKHTLTYQYNTNLDSERNVDLFLKAYNSLIKRLKYNYIIGAVTFLPLEADYINAYSIPFSFSVFKKIIKQIPISNTVVENSIKFKTNYVIDILDKCDSSLLLFLNKHAFDSCCVTADSSVDNLMYNNFGDKYIVKNVSIKDYSELTDDPIKLLEFLADLIKNTSCIVPINKVYVFGNAFCTAETLANVLNLELKDGSPFVIGVTDEDIYKYASDIIKNNHIKHIFESNFLK